MATTTELETDSSQLRSSTMKGNVVVTGFGPFEGHPINASWEAVQLLPQTNVDNKLNANLIIQQIPVTYEHVEKTIPDLWRQYNPVLMIHVGVSNLARNLTLERCARRSGYDKCDIDGQKPACNSCSAGTEDLIHSTIDILELSKCMNSTKSEVTTSVSTDAGRYLCEYIYYTSLSQDKSRCIFVHVPCIGKPYSAIKIATGLRNIIEILLDKISVIQ